jgi:hypothetical protein
MPRISGMDMLKAVVTDINSLDEGLRGYYVQKDGKFFLNVTPADGFELDNVQGLKTALGAERNNVAVLREQMKPYEGLDANLARTAIERIGAFGDITPDAARTALETAQRLSAFDPKKEAEQIAETKLNTIKEQLAAQFGLEKTDLTTKIKSHEETINSLTGQLQGVMRDAAIKTEVAKSNPLDDARDAVELLVAQNVRTRIVDGRYVVEVLDSNGNPRMKDYVQNIPFTVADLVADLRESKSALFKPDDKRGMGVPPNNSGSNNQNPGAPKTNPWAKETFNFTQQMTLARQNPNLARQLASQAGVEPNF